MTASPPDYGYWQRADLLIRLALEEDLPARDVTTEAVLNGEERASAALVARQDLVVSGLPLAARVFEAVDRELRWVPRAADGDRAAAGEVLARVEGRAASLLAAERTALNFLQHLCGIATAVRRTVEEVSGLPVLVLDTRKTLPGWRLLQKKAVRDGGGANHRFSLSDSVLIKDNHAALAGGVGAAVRRARASLPPRTRIEAEAATLEEIREAVDAGADVVLFDNAATAALREAVDAVGGRVPLEASGGITPEDVREVALTGVNMISMGALTHSVRAADISMEIE